MSEGRRKILLIEGNGQHAKVIRQGLIDAGADTVDVTCRDCLSSGIDCLNDGDIDVVLLNPRLSDGDGPNAVSRIVAKAGDVPVLVIASYTDQESYCEVIRAGAEDYIDKTKLSAETLLRSARIAIERKRAQGRTATALRESESRLRAIINAALDCIITMDSAGKIVHFNPAAEETFGYKRGEVLGKDMGELFMPAAVSARQKRNFELYRGTGAGSMLGCPVETNAFRKDGSEFIAEMTIQPVRIDGEVVFTIFLRDISHRKQAEQTLRDSEALYSSLVEALPLNVLRKDLQGRITFANKMFCELTGKPRGELLGKTDLDLYPKELAEKYRKDDQRVLETREMIDDIEQHVEDGKSSYVHVRKTPLLDSAGKIQGTQAVFEDVSERIQTQEELARYTNELKQSNRDLEQFAYVASHDLQEPLRSIAGYAQLLHVRLRDKLDDDTREFLTYLSDAAKRMQGLIHGLLDYARVGRDGRLFEPTDLDALLDAKLCDLGSAIQECGAVITRDPLPTVTADPVQLGQLFQNLISNALKYRGERRPEVHIGVEQNEEVWTFSVRDNGIGIPQEQFERIFVIFQRLHGQGEYSGLGIGLSLVKRIVDRHGGRIWVESQAGRGSTFFFTLPVRPAARPR
ncbi:MAG: PAS domain S-box protein [Planctomycetota bacterium]|nr:PAS domain S-box protein [Planctomycetota bacterium]